MFRLLLICLVVFSCHNKQVPSTSLNNKFDVEGHRGCRGLMPENTIPAMIKGIQLGVTTLEMDAVITKDKKVILSHEPFFAADISTSPDGKTFTNSEEKKYNLYQMTYAEIETWDVGLKPHPRFPRQQKLKVHKPLLSDVIDSVEQYIGKNNLSPVSYNIETKTYAITDNIYHPAPEEFVQLLLAVINEKGIKNKTIIQSFDIRTLQIIHRLDSSIKTALLIEGYNKKTAGENCKQLGFIPTIYSPEFNLVNEELVSYCKNNNMLLIPWTVNDKINIDRLVKIGVNGIITDYPDLFR